jgi:ATP-grasp domain, R2K clade family 3
MTTCRWIIENFSEGEDIFLLIQAVKDAGHPLTLINRRNGFEYKHIQFENECVVFYGSINMAKLIKEHLQTCHPVVWETNAFECTHYWPHYKHLLFNDNHEFTTVKNLKEHKFEYYSKYGKEAMIFIRPNTGDKTFAGQLLDLIDFDSFFNHSTRCNAAENDIIIVSTPKNIVSEYRYIITDEKKIISKSCYRFHGKITSVPGAPDAATKCVEKVLDVGIFPAKIFSVDVVEDEDANFWLMEFNSFNSCGLYSTNKRAIVDEASMIAIKEYELRSNRKSVV